MKNRHKRNRMTAATRLSRRCSGAQSHAAMADLQTALRELHARNADLERARRAAQRASEAKSVLLAGMSHEIRTPLNVMLGFSQLLLHSSVDPLQRDYVETIRSSARNLLELLNSSIELAGVESGLVPLNVEHIDLNALLNDIHSLFAPSAYDRGIEFHTAPLEQRHAQVRSDPLRLRQILINLTDNAMKFTHTGHVLLSARLLRIAGRRRWVRFAVQDTGPGMPQTTQGRIFEPFCQPVTGHRHAAAGSGLGLHIVKQIVMLMEGDITVRSAPGKGASFFVTLPLPIDGAHAEPPFGTQLPALLVTDGSCPAIARHQRRFFERAGLIPVEKPRGRSGIVVVELSAAALRAGKQSMPCEAANRCDWPRIAYCSSWDPSIVRQLERRYTGVIVKTGCPRRFRTRLDNILRGNSPLPRCRTPTGYPATGGFTGRLLVIDDHEVSLTLMRHFCAELGVDADFRSSSPCALRSLRKTRYNMILLDIHMPDIDGFELARQVRSDNGENRDTPIVALTADVGQDEAGLIECGMQGLLLKPVSLAALRATIGRWAGPSPAVRSRTEELRQVLRGQLPEDRAALVSLARTRSYAQLALTAHRLHGASLYCDAPKLSLAVRRLEGAARSAERGSVQEALDEALIAIDESLHPAQST